MRRLIALFTPARLAAACTAVVFGAAFAISWESLRVLALAAGIRPLLAPLFPLTVDAVMVTGTVAAVALRTVRWRIRAYTWLMVAAGIAVSVLGNAVHSSAHDEVLSLPLWAAAAASAVPALSLAASLHLFVLVLRHGRQTDDTVEHVEVPAEAPIPVDISEPVEVQPVAPNGRVQRRTSSGTTRRSSGVRVRALLARHGDDLTPDTVARRLKVSRRHAQRLLRQAVKVPAGAEQVPESAPISQP